MIPLPYSTGKTFGVVGLGASGMAAVHALHESGAAVEAWDDNADKRDALPDGVHALAPDNWDWSDMTALVLSPGIPLTHPAPHHVVQLARQYGVPIIGDIEMLYQANPTARYVGITGTNGKSTTTALIGHILRYANVPCEVGGNLGKPVMEMDVLGADGVYVLELSSYQLDLLRSTKIDVAVWLNISPDHIDRHGDLRGYMAAKAHIFDRQDAQCHAIIGVDDVHSEGFLETHRLKSNATIWPISATHDLAQGVYVQGGRLHAVLGDDGAQADVSNIATLQGTHNAQNIAAAYAACRALGVAHATIVEALASFKGLAHRMQLVKELDGVRFVNDSKATNADAAARSLGTYERIYWIAGGVAKDGGIASLSPYYGRVAHAYLIGEAQDAFAATLEGKVAYSRCDTMQNAFAQAVRDARADNSGNATVLLAPACASFDQYANFEKRGDAFIALVRDYAAKENASHAI